MLQGDISRWRTILARIYFGEGYAVAFFAGGGSCVRDERDCAGCGPFSRGADYRVRGDEQPFSFCGIIGGKGHIGVLRIHKKKAGESVSSEERS